MCEWGGVIIVDGMEDGSDEAEAVASLGALKSFVDVESDVESIFATGEREDLGLPIVGEGWTMGGASGRCGGVIGGDETAVIERRATVEIGGARVNPMAGLKC